MSVLGKSVCRTTPPLCLLGYFGSHLPPHPIPNSLPPHLCPTACVGLAVCQSSAMRKERKWRREEKKKKKKKRTKEIFEGLKSRKDFTGVLIILILGWRG